MVNFYKEAIKELEGYISNANFYTKKQFGKLTGLQWFDRKKDIIRFLKTKMNEYEKELEKLLQK